jgi:hypothetical protein
MIRSAGRRGPHGAPHLDLHLKPRDTEAIEAALCRAEFQLDPVTSLRMPLPVLCSQPGMPHVAKMHSAARLEALRWLARRGMALNVARLLRVWRLAHYTLRGSASSSTVLAALPGCPNLQSLEVWDADLGVHDVGNLCASHLRVLRLQGCAAEPLPGRWAGGRVAASRGSPLRVLVATGGNPDVIDAVTYLVHRSSLHTLKLNLGHTVRQVIDLLEALSAHPGLTRIEIRLDELTPLMVFLTGLKLRRDNANLRTVKLYCSVLSSPLGASADQKEHVFEQANRLLDGNALLKVRFFR